MRPYGSPGSRAAFGLAALAMTAATVGLLVVAPARLDTQPPVVLTASAKDAQAADTDWTAWPVREAR